MLHRVPEYFESTRCIVTRAYPWSTLSTIRNQPRLHRGRVAARAELTARWPSCVPIHGVVYSIRSSQTIQHHRKTFHLAFRQYRSCIDTSPFQIQNPYIHHLSFNSGEQRLHYFSINGDIQRAYFKKGWNQSNRSTD